MSASIFFYLPIVSKSLLIVLGTLPKPPASKRRATLRAGNPAPNLQAGWCNFSPPANCIAFLLTLSVSSLAHAIVRQLDFFIFRPGNTLVTGTTQIKKSPADRAHDGQRDSLTSLSDCQRVQLPNYCPQIVAPGYPGTQVRKARKKLHRGDA